MTNSALPLQHFRIVMSNTSHPGNIGAAARAMKTMGIQQLYLVQPKIFPAHEATAMAANADDILAQAVRCDSLDEALQGCALSIGLSARRRQISHELVDVREAAKRAAQIQAVKAKLSAGAQRAKEIGKKLRVTGYVRWSVK